MHVILHAHHAVISESLRSQTENAMQRVSTRMRKIANAIVRFIGDGPTHRVEIELLGTHSRPLVSHGDGPDFAPALAQAVHRIERQIDRVRTQRERRLAPPGEFAE
ncbi:MAG: HPF/RaiA family ribosome-associated protein [Gemmatimonadaceae bacterium]